MPMMLDQYLAFPDMRSERPLQGNQTYYSHPRRQATKCGHIIHPSASEHTPLCPACLTSRAKSYMNVALKGLIAEGGPSPSDSMRDRRWQRAKLRYDIAKQRQAKIRSRDQLREEREQTWNEMHQRAGSQRLQATTTFQEPADCTVCETMIATYPTQVSVPQTAKDTAWWERPGGLVVDDILVPRTPLRPVRQARQNICKTQGTSVLRGMARNFRRAMTASEAHREIWEFRYRTETAIRRKHGLGEGFHFEPDFWDSPISAHLTRQYYQQAEEEARMAARRARGNTPRPRPPRSSLSYSERSDEIDVDEGHLEHIWKMEEQKIQDRQARKVGEEVGYLYFVGVDGLLKWKDDYLRSDRGLVYRKKNTEPESDGVMSMSDSGDSDSDDSREDEYKDRGEDEEDYDEMDMDM
ncbi:hypothetical protein HBI04_150250 [Parastagonospora nodorum]|nr:hypothetical protein HBI03_097060 [Parastagonospora nodorum]KAH4271007.1 hypothetical protein HBI04_150250 [Parastagonospora nodorum]KAH5327726.1 hypothetical protein HBI50_076930 [Parastagonospora nodorum]KAH5399331.1 hypothetical protein HBI32_183300 [Parastagonospora nodorum]KAH5600086.1 hypothetical protein HBI45_145870 [Parastagonospora nodorum]